MSNRSRGGGFGSGFGAGAGPTQEREKQAERSAVYEIIGVPRTASAKEIKTAYHKAIVANHPDKNSDPNSALTKLRTTLLNDAYNILKTPDLRAKYDGAMFEDSDYWEHQEEDLRTRLNAVTDLAATEAANKVKAAEEAKQREEALATKRRETEEAKRRADVEAAERQKAQQEREEAAKVKAAAEQAAQLTAAQAAAEELHKQAEAEEAKRKAEAKEARRVALEKAAAERAAQAAALDAEILAKEQKESKELKDKQLKELARLKRALGSPDFWKKPISKQDLDSLLSVLATDPTQRTKQDEKERKQYEAELDQDSKDEFQEILAEYLELRKKSGFAESPEAVRERKLNALIEKLRAIPYFWSEKIKKTDLTPRMALKNLVDGDAATMRKISSYLNPDHRDEFEELFEQWQELNKEPETLKMERFMANPEAVASYNELDVGPYWQPNAIGAFDYISGKVATDEFKKGIIDDKQTEVMEKAERLKAFYGGAEWQEAPEKKAAREAAAKATADAEAATKKAEEEARLKAEAEAAALEATKKTSKLALSGWLLHFGNEFGEHLASQAHTRDLEAFITEQEGAFATEVAKHPELSEAEQQAMYDQFNEKLHEKKLEKFKANAQQYFDDVTKEVAKYKTRYKGDKLAYELKELVKDSRTNFKWMLKQFLPFKTWKPHWDQLTKLLQSHIPEVRDEPLKEER